MSLAKRDIVIQTMLTELENKRLLLKSKYKELHNASAENELLKDVLEDYLLYYKDIEKEKKLQYDALNKTLEHIDNIAVDAKTSEHLKKNIKFDQREILSEMNRIKREMKTLD